MPSTSFVEASTSVNTESCKRDGREVSGRQYTQIATPSGVYDILSHIKPIDHPEISSHLSALGWYALEPRDVSRKVVLGSGNFGSVRFAQSEKHPLCVVKKLNETDGQEELAAISLLSRVPSQERYLFVQTFNAANAIGKKGHTNVYLFQEYVAGGDLASRSETSRLNPGFRDDCDDSVKLDVALAMCRPIAALHRVGLYHRDIKPANYLIQNGQVKLADFGFLTDQLLPGFSGTRLFMPPEYRTGCMRADQHDSFSLGIILYDLSGGEHPTQEYRLDETTQLSQCEPFLYDCYKSIVQNRESPSLRSIALQLMHPNVSVRLSVVHAECILNAIINSTGSEY